MNQAFKEISTLLIEDHPGDARLITEYLKESFLEFQPAVEVADTLDEGIDWLKQEDFDVILLDLSLPDSFGMDTFDRVLKEVGTIPIIVLTGLDDERLGIEAVEAGAQDFLKKGELSATLLGRSILYALQRNQLNARLEENKERLQQAQELAHLGNYEIDLKTGEIRWSDETFRIFEMDPNHSEPSYEELKPMIFPKYREDIDAVIENVRKTGQRDYLELGINTQNGQQKYLYSIVDPVKNKNGEVVRIFGTTQDITDRKNAELQLRENEQRYRMLFQCTTDEILVFQLDDDMESLPYMEVNDTACELLGYTREELLQKTPYDIVGAEPQEIRKRIETVFRQGEGSYESQHVTKDGTMIPIDVSARSFIYQDRVTIISIGRDVRERRKLEQEVLSISEQERQRIGRDMHDDLGQMLTGVGLMAKNLASSLKSQEIEEADEAQEIADMIKEADERARALARGLVPVNVQSNGLDSALEELTKESEKIYDINIDYTNDCSIELHDNSSAIHLYRIAQEAINNAIKHGKTTNIEVELNESGGQIMLRVDDNGNGLPEEPEQRGDGMGLRIMHFRAQMIGGNLEINSKNGEGTEILCRMPL